MGKGLSAVLGGVIGAAVGVVLAPRRRRVAARGARLGCASQRVPGRGSVRAFAGTPCAADGRARVHVQGGAPRARWAPVRLATQGGDQDG